MTGLRQVETRLGEERGRFEALDEEFRQFRTEKEVSVQNERQTVSLLVSEKASLITELQRLEGLELSEFAACFSFYGYVNDLGALFVAEAQGTEEALREEQAKVQNLDAQVHELEKKTQEASKRAQLSETKEKELSERCRDQVWFSSSLIWNLFQST